ncbi:MAG: hypothetical protein RI894_2241 [Bacteroidota bacterium]|jgi:aerobic C4-dicarboxylate transport protein
MFKKIATNLTFWVLVSLVAGACLGYFAPKTAVEMKRLSEWFISIIKIFIIPIIFLTITVGISGMGKLKQVGKTGGKALLYFEIVTTFALFIGVFVANIIRPGDGIDTSKTNIAEVAKFTAQADDFSWLKFLQDNMTLQVLIFSVVFGIILLYMKPKNAQENEADAIIKFLTMLSGYVFKALHYVMFFAPIAAFGGMAFTVGKFGINSLLALGKLMLTFYSTAFLFVFVILGLLLRYYNISLWKLLIFIKEELLIVLGTASSETVLPAIIAKLERFGCRKSVVSLVIPAGYSFNLDGTTIYLSMAIIFLAQAYKIELSWGEIGSIIGVLMVSSKGAAGVVGSAFIVLASTLKAIHVIPIEGLALLIGIDRFMAEARAITNIIGNSVATIFIANNEGEFDRVKYEAIS